MEILQNDKVNFELLLETAKKHREFVAKLPKTVWNKNEAPFLDNSADFEKIFPNRAQYEKIISLLSYQQLLDFVMEMTNGIEDIALIFNHQSKYYPNNLKEVMQNGGDKYHYAQYKYACYKIYFPLRLLYVNELIYCKENEGIIVNNPVFLADLCRNFRAHNREVPKELEHTIIYAIKNRYNMIKGYETKPTDINDILDYMQNKIPMNEEIYNSLYFLPVKDISIANTVEKGFHSSYWVTMEAYEASCRLDGVKPERDNLVNERQTAKLMKMVDPYRYGDLDLEQDKERLFAQQDIIWNKIYDANNKYKTL